MVNVKGFQTVLTFFLLFPCLAKLKTKTKFSILLFKVRS